MSTSNATNVAIPKAGKYGNASKVLPLLSPLISSTSAVRLGNSGLKVSRIILGPFSRFGEKILGRSTYQRGTLGCMSYGSTKCAEWMLGEKEGLEHIKFA